MAYTAIDDPEAYFRIKLYTGDGSQQAITFDTTDTSMQPDFLWFKGRNSAQPHGLYDSIRGVNKSVRSNDSSAEETSTSMSAFSSNGFTVENNGKTGENAVTYVAWCWKAGTTSIPSGSTSDPSGVSFSATSGLGIYAITSPGSGNYALKHGLGTAPNFIIVKDLEATQKWMTWSDQFSNLTDDYLQLNDTAAKATYSTCWSTMNTTDATIATGGTLDVNNDHIIYVFSNRQGFSRTGSYTGNGNADGPFIYTGFRPAWLVVKRTIGGTQDWELFDNKINPYNVATIALRPNVSNGEQTGNAMDLLSNGFKNRLSGSSVNTDGDTYTYLAFAEAPFVNSNGVPCNAR